MPQRKSDWRLGHASPDLFVIAKSTETAKVGATQHSTRQLEQSARRSRPEVRSSGESPVSDISDIASCSPGIEPIQCSRCRRTERRIDSSQEAAWHGGEQPCPD